MGELDQINKTRIHQALSEHRTRQAVLIVDSLLCGIELISEQRPAVIEALIDYGNKVLREQPESPRREIVMALNAYSEEALVEARERERRLFSAITGAEDEGGE
jgi:hypothetical protein